MNKTCFVLTFHDYDSNDHWPLGVFSTQELAITAMINFMSSVYEQNDYSEADTDWLTGACSYFYDDVKIEIEINRFCMDE